MVVSGNGGIANHRAMHERREDGHRYLSSIEAYERRAALSASAEQHAPSEQGYVPARVSEEPKGAANQDSGGSRR